MHAPITKLIMPEAVPWQLDAAKVVTTTYGTVGSGGGGGAIARNDPILSGAIEHTPMEPIAVNPAAAV